MAGYSYLWEFIVESRHIDEFQQRYGPSGPWVALFGCLKPGQHGHQKRSTR